MVKADGSFFNNIKHTAGFLISPILLIMVWQAVVFYGVVSDQLLPSPLHILQRVIYYFFDDDFFTNFLVTGLRLFLGLAIAILVGVGLGLIAQVSITASFLLSGAVRILAPIPKIALYPALILIFGFDHSSKVVLVALDAVFPILMATWAAAEQVDKKLVWSARAMGTSALRVMYQVYLPAILPTLLAGIRVASVIACVVVFLAEMIASTDGLGHMLTIAARSYVVVDMFVPLIWICGIGMALNYVIGSVQQRLKYE